MNAITYIRNVGKSFGYIGIDVAKSSNPAVADLVKQAKDITTDLYQSIRDFKSNSSLSGEEKSLIGIAKSTVTDTCSSILEDIKTGNFYNKQRSDKAMMEAFGFGDDLSFNLDDDFGDFDFQFEDDDSNTSNGSFTEQQLALDQKNTKAIIASVDMVGEKTANAIASTTAKSATYIAQIQRESSKALYGLTHKGFENVSVGIASINSNLASVLQLAEPLTAHMQNSTTFYTHSTEFQKEALDLLKQLVQNTSPISPKSNRSSRTKNTISDLMTGGVLDVRAYMDMVKGNTREYTDMIKSMFGMIVGPMTANVKSSPLSMAMSGIIKAAIPKVLKESQKEFNEFLEGFFATGLGKLKNKSGGAIFELLKDIFVPKSAYTDKIDPSKYNKGRVDWDGKSRKALMEVIPRQLSRIVSALTGRPEEIFDYESGKWITVKSVQTNFNDDKRRHANAANYDYINYLESTISKLESDKKISRSEADRMKKQTRDYNYNAFHSNSDEFTKIMNKDFNYSKFGMDRETWELIRMLNRNLDSQKKSSVRTKYYGDIFNGRDRFGEKMRDIESEGSIYNTLFDDSVKEDEKARTLIGVDEYNNDMFFYLQGIYQFTQHVSDNLDVFAGGRRLRGSSIARNGKVTSIKPISGRPNKDQKNDIDSRIRESNFAYSTISNEDVQSSSYSVLNNEKIYKYASISDENLKQYAIAKEAAKMSNDSSFKKDPELEKELDKWQRAQRVTKGLGSFFDKAKSPISKAINRLYGGKADAAAKFYGTLEQSMRAMLLGEGLGPNEKGIMQTVNDSMSGIFANLSDKLESIFGMWAPFFKTVLGRLVGVKDPETGLRSKGLFSGFMNETASSLKSAGRWAKNVFTGKNQFTGSAARGRKVTKTGVVAVSEGEMIIPAELNPLYNKKIDKAAQLRNEYDSARKFYGAFSNGTTGVGSTEDGEFPDSILGALGYFFKKGGSTLGKGVGKLASNLMPTGTDVEKEKEKLTKTTSSILDSLGESKGAMAAGAIIGSGVSLFTGGLIGPIFGASVGAATGLIVKSKTVQKALFGYDDEDGHHKGLFSDNLSKFIQKKVPVMAKGSLVGATGGLFMGSPLMGAIIGSGVGFAASSEKIKSALFGDPDKDNGLISQEFRKKVKSALPNMSAGALAGLIAGPFGLAGNLIVGSALGYASSTDKFKNWLFGDKNKKDSNGNRTDLGFAGLLKDNFVDPVVKIFDRLGEDIKHTIRNTFNSLGKNIKRFVQEKMGAGVRGKAARAIGKAANVVTGGGVRAVGGILKGIGNRMDIKALRKGYNIKDRKKGRNLTAAERLEMRGSLGTSDKFGDVDNLIASINSTDEADDLIKLLTQMRDPTKAYDEERSKSRRKTINLLNNIGSSLSGDEFKAYIGHAKKIESYIKGKKYDKALIEVDSLNIDEKSKNDLRQEISTQMRAYETANDSMRGSKIGKNLLLANSKFKGAKFLKDSNIDNVIDLTKTEMSTRLKDKVGKDKDTVIVDTIPDLLKRILIAVSHDPEAIADLKGELKSPELMTAAQKAINNINADTKSAEEKLNKINYGEEITDEGTVKQDENGNMMIFSNGHWEYDVRDKETRENIKGKKSISNALLQIPIISSSIGKIQGLFGGLKNKLFGSGESNKDDKGILGSLFPFLTGLGNNISVKLSSLLAGVLPAAFFTAAASGKFDTVANKLGLGGKADAETLTSGAKLTDAQGAPLTAGPNGTYLHADGTPYTGKVYNASSKYSSSTTPFSSKLLQNEARQFLIRGTSIGAQSFSKIPIIGNLINAVGNGYKNLGTKVASGLFNKTTTNLAKNGVSSYLNEAGKIVFANTDEAAGLAAKKVVAGIGEEGAEFFVKNMDTVTSGLTKSVDKDGLFKKLCTLIEKNVAKASAKEISSCSKVIPVIGQVITIAAFLADFTDGYSNPHTVFKMTAEPTAEMKLFAGLTKALIGLIPFIGPLIPLDSVVSLLADYICPVIGISRQDFDKYRNEATNEVNNYNKANSTNLSFDEYNTTVLQNYSAIDQIVNGSKDVAGLNISSAKNIAGKILNGKYEGNIIDGMLSDISDTYNQYIYQKTVMNLEAEIRENMRSLGNGSINEEEIKSQLDMVLMVWLNETEQGRKCYKYSELYKNQEFSEASYQKYLKEKESYRNTSAYQNLAYTGTRVVGEEDYQRMDSYTSSNGVTHAGGGRRSSGSGSGLSAGGSFISQRDAKYRNMRLGGSSIENNGCGPATAVMALNQYSQKANMNNAIDFANGYQSGTGTDAAFFSDYYKKNGANAQYYDGTSMDGQSNIIRNIQSGKPVVLMGQDIKNRSKANSPFGPNNHYVVASGFDGSGNLIINDPESKYGNKKYKPSILRNIKLGIGISGGASNYSHELRNDNVTRTVWSFFKQKGYSDAATSAIMGNLHQESGIDPTRLQIKGTAKGIAQWEGGRYTALVDYAKSRNVDWTDLMTQLLFIDQEVNGTQKWAFKSKAGMNVEAFKVLTDVSQATIAFEKAYERAGSPNFEARVSNAAYYYNEFSGKIYNIPSTISAGTSSSISGTTSSSTGGFGVLSTILGAFGKIGGLLSPGNSSDNSTTATTDGTYSNASSTKYSGKTPVDFMKSVQGKLKYDQTNRDPEAGSGDCSSTIRWAVKKATGVDIGGYTGAQYTNSNLNTVWYGNGNTASSLPNGIQPNDILFYRRSKSKYTDKVGHVEMYMGDNKMIGHGGGSDGKTMGPTIKNASSNNLLKVMRVAGSASGSGLIDLNNTASGSGLVLLNNSRKNRNPYDSDTNTTKLSYGGKIYSAGASSITPTKNRSVGSNNYGISKDTAAMLKVIITLIESLVSNTDKIDNIYAVLSEYCKANLGSKAAIATEALNKMSSKSDSSMIEANLSNLKATVDSILAS